MKRWMHIIAACAALCASPTLAQKMGPHLPAPGADPKCDTGTNDPDAILVCGSRDSGERYRIPENLRDSGKIDSRNMSWAARERDGRSVAEYGAQTVGPWGALQHSKQVNCEWKAARQEQQGRQIDCTKRARGDRAGDWNGDRR